LEPQPLEFVNRQAPETKRSLRQALHAVEQGNLSPEALEEELEGFYKLKVDRYRFILQHAKDPAGPFFRVVFCERRKVAYELFAQLLGLE